MLFLWLPCAGYQSLLPSIRLGVEEDAFEEAESRRDSSVLDFRSMDALGSSMVRGYCGMTRVSGKCRAELLDFFRVTPLSPPPGVGV